SEVLWENRWAEQSGLIASNPIYSLVDIYGGGCLVDCYERERSRRCPGRIIKEERALPVQRRGDGIEISGSDLIRKPVTKYEVPDEDPLKNQKRHGVHLGCAERGEVNSVPTISRTAAQKNVPMRLFASAAAVFDNNIKHLVCWDITNRVGVSTLAIILVGMFPNLAKDFFIGWEYFDRERFSSRQVPIFISERLATSFSPTISAG
uniref:Monocarboxylate transporter n=1 Tax=Macrostomum lignano TaxID=282301 RepID=A0A1I8FM18_9PLAT